MIILLDQNVPRIIKNWLKTIKPEWEIIHTSDLGLAEESDEKIFAVAQTYKAIIITFDEDFSDIRIFQQPHAGVIRLNVWPTTVEETQSALTRLFKEINDKEIQGSLIIIDRHKIRIRKNI